MKYAAENFSAAKEILVRCSYHEDLAHEIAADTLILPLLMTR